MKTFTRLFFDLSKIQIKNAHVHNTWLEGAKLFFKVDIGLPKIILLCHNNVQAITQKQKNAYFARKAHY